MENILRRHSSNPVLKPADLPFDCFAAYNGGAVKCNDEYIVMVRAEDSARRQFAWTARSSDGIKFTPDNEPVKFTADDMDAYQSNTNRSWYDPRINTVDGEYYITYAASSQFGCRIGLGKTSDFKTVEHVSFPLHISNRNAVLFPEKINGMYVMLHRPENNNGDGNIWISRSPDLHFWGNSELLIKCRSDRWDCVKIGAGPPPIKTDEGWLVIIHAVCGSCAGHYYTVGTALLDLDDPYKLIGRSTGCIMRPEAEYEQRGFVPNVIFPAGAIVEDDGTVKVYYGAADNYECLAETTLSELLATVKK
ncbi:MAG: glycoside hydrolase family 130 protein [Planctomycetota bacterium]|jgi:predicted GH43/DUF377 family glycosyl hydrolase